jgi:adenine specific DNA methylase Mod
MVLFFPFKDCVLEGGQSKDDEKRKEIFFNEVLAKDEINRLSLMIRLSLIKPFSLRLKFTSSLTPFWVYFLALVMTFLFNKRLISTKFSNKVGLTVSNKHIQQINEVVLSFPFKDCVLEGGQSKDDEKRKEIFFNEGVVGWVNINQFYFSSKVAFKGV